MSRPIARTPLARPLLARTALPLAAALLLIAAGLAEAQTFRGRGGGGGGFNRQGPAGFGGFSGRGTNPASTQARQTGATERTETRQAGATERTETRTETRSNTANAAIDEWDDNHWGYWGTGAAVGVGVAAGVAAGTAAAATAPPAAYITVLPCQPVVIVAAGRTYYQCGPTWYGRTYVNSDVVYVVVPPPGSN